MSEALDKVVATQKRLKVFPLPSVVLLPGGALPLHIFEPRYRALVKDALASDGVLAMAQVVPGQEGSLAGKPELDSMVCAGVISLHEELEDGRYNVVLVGVSRARIVRELPTRHAYREIEILPLPDDGRPSGDDPSLRQALMELVARIPQGGGEKLAQVTAHVHGGTLADIVAGAVVGDVAQRYELLNELDASRRVRSVAEEVLSIAARLKTKKNNGLLN